MYNPTRRALDRALTINQRLIKFSKRIFFLWKFPNKANNFKGKIPQTTSRLEFFNYPTRERQSRHDSTSIKRQHNSSITKNSLKHGEQSSLTDAIIITRPCRNFTVNYKIFIELCFDASFVTEKQRDGQLTPSDRKLQCPWFRNHHRKDRQASFRSNQKSIRPQSKRISATPNWQCRYRRKTLIKAKKKKK